jgi:hypothetical protein
MAHFAKLNKIPNADGTHTVLAVNPMNDSVDEVELSNRTGELFKKCSYNTRSGIYYTPNTDQVDPDQTKALRKNFPSVGYLYNPEKDAFHGVKTFNDFVYNEERGDWEAPTPRPSTIGENGLAEEYHYEEGIGWIKD